MPFLGPACAKKASVWATAKIKNDFFAEITKQIISFPKLFILSKYHVFAELWMFSYFVWCFLLKRVISSHSSCVFLHTYPIFMHFKFHPTNKAGILMFITPKKRNESRRYIYSYYIKQTAHLGVYYLAKMPSNSACK